MVAELGPSGSFRNRMSSELGRRVCEMSHYNAALIPIINIRNNRIVTIGGHYREFRENSLLSPSPLIWDLKSYLAFLRSTAGAPQEGQVGLQIPNRGEGRLLPELPLSSQWLCLTIRKHTSWVVLVFIILQQ